MAEIWYLVTSVIYVYHIVGSVFGPVRFLLPVCWLSWFLYTLNIYVHFCHIFLSNYWWQKSDIWSQASYRYKCTPYCGKRFWTHQIPTSCLPTLLIFIHIEHICSFFVAFFSATIYGRNLIFGHKLHIGTPYRGKHFWTHQIPTSCLPILLIFIHIEHTFVYAHFSSHFSKQLLMTGIWYLVTSFI